MNDCLYSYFVFWKVHPAIVGHLLFFSSHSRSFACTARHLHSFCCCWCSFSLFFFISLHSPCYLFSFSVELDESPRWKWRNAKGSRISFYNKKAAHSIAAVYFSLISRCVFSSLNLSLLHVFFFFPPPFSFLCLWCHAWITPSFSLSLSLSSYLLKFSPTALSSLLVQHLLAVCRSGCLSLPLSPAARLSTCGPGVGVHVNISLQKLKKIFSIALRSFCVLFFFFWWSKKAARLVQKTSNCVHAGRREETLVKLSCSSFIALLFLFFFRFSSKP